jgi:hypothetical protein
MLLWLVPALLTVLAAPPDTGALLSSPDRRVRSMDRRINELLEIGLRRSPTFAQLVTTLNTSDVIVYVERSHDLPKALAGRMVMLPITGRHRYLRIQIRTDLTAAETISLIGHELRHALEIADAPTVRDATGMLSLYQKIGHPSAGTLHTYDTDAAQAAGRQVRMELAS